MEALSRALEKALRWAAVLLLTALLASVVIGVLSRLVNQPVAWSDETAQYLLVWTGFVGWMIAARRRSHIRINVFVDLLPAGARVAAEVAIQASVIVLAAALLRFGWPLIGRNWDVEWVSLPLPSGLLYLPMPFAAAVLVGQALLEIGQALRGRAGGAPGAGRLPP
ncbi:MAG: TRAP transporter small permease [Alphaproteobacteria bacterium]|nr:TRAP transporter small permease [Alphaproteobacteria bacterium]